MDVKYMNPFITAFTGVMPMLGFNKVTKGDLSVKDKNITFSGVICIVGLVGEVKGNVVYCFNMENAKKIASTMMMGMPVNEFDDMAKSAISELTNMLTANAATVFEANGISIDISTPTLLHGENVEVSLKTNQAVGIQMFVDDIEVVINIGYDK